MGYEEYYWRHYRPTTPIIVKDGIRIRKQTGEIGETWWGKRFLSILDNFGWSKRLSRGRNYARSGQVIEYNIDHGLITSKVQGSKVKPYSISIKIKTLSKKQWSKVIAAMASQARFLAKLLSGDMPHDIEDLFASINVPLFPSSEKDFDAECSCPDWANPCKHIAAVYYVVGEAFDRNPFLIFHLRGLKKDELLAALRKENCIPDTKTQAEKKAEEKAESKVEVKAEAKPLTSDPVLFWKATPISSTKGMTDGIGKKIDYQFSLKRPPLNAAILHRLGVPQFWMDSANNFYKIIEGVYRDATDSALKIAYQSAEGHKK